MSSTPGPAPHRQIRAVFDATTITVYQAFSPVIAAPAVAAQRFVEPFSRTRMTWIKPSFLWMAYRCGWGTKPGQTTVLAIQISRSGFEHALSSSCLSHHDPRIQSYQQWEDRRDATSIRIQWDPERDLHHQPTGVRSIQIGIGGDAVARYVDEWTVSITDVTSTMTTIAELVAARDIDSATRLLPAEEPYPTPPGIVSVIGGTPPDDRTD